MRVRVVLALTGLALAFVASPAHGESDHIAIVPDGTYSYNIFSALLQQQTEAKRDSAKAPALWLAAAGGALGLAGYFVLSPGSTPGLGSQTPLPPPGGLTPPPQITWTPRTPPPGGSNDPPGTDVIDPDPNGPVTTTPEPVTMTLLASGLAGLGGASLLRRRRPTQAE